MTVTRSVMQSLRQRFTVLPQQVVPGWIKAIGGHNREAIEVFGYATEPTTFASN